MQFKGIQLVIMWTERRTGQLPRSPSDHRSPYERDKTRVIHCPAFRRLQRKTQILGTTEGDFHRTRLTHSLEVASIGESMVHHLTIKHQNEPVVDLLPPHFLINVICLLHDIGHPPFGHGGEVALNFMMRDHGGFEGNAQTLRLLTKLESSYGEHGLDLTRRTLLGILKYPAPRAQVVATTQPQVLSSAQKSIRVNDWLPPKAYYETEQQDVMWLLEPFSLTDQQHFQSLAVQPSENRHGKTAHHNFDCSIMNIADDIAYGVHDLEDAIHLKLIHRDEFDTPIFHEHLRATTLNQNTLVPLLFDTELHKRKEAIGELVNYFITSTSITLAHEAFEHDNLKYKVVLLPEAAGLLAWLVEHVYRYVIDSQQARTFEFGGQTIILRLFEALTSNPMGLLDTTYRQRYQRSTDESAAYRIICDTIANMTDEYAHRMHERLFGFNTKAYFER